MPESNVLAMVSVPGSSTGGSAAPSQQTTTTKSRAMQASDKEAAYLQKYFDEHSVTSEVRACSFLCSPLSVTRPAALVLCTSWLHQQIQQRSFAQDILKELIGAENVCTPKHLAALREKPDAAVAMVQSVHKSAYPPPAAKRGRPAKKAAAEKAASDRREELLRVRQEQDERVGAIAARLEEAAEGNNNGIPAVTSADKQLCKDRFEAVKALWVEVRPSSAPLLSQQQ